MQVTTVGIEYKRKFNLGNYESLELSINLYSKVNPDEDAEGVSQLLWEQGKASVKEQAAPILRSIKYQAQVHQQPDWVSDSGNLEEF